GESPDAPVPGSAPPTPANREEAGGNGPVAWCTPGPVSGCGQELDSRIADWIGCECETSDEADRGGRRVECGDSARGRDERMSLGGTIASRERATAKPAKAGKNGQIVS